MLKLLACFLLLSCGTKDVVPQPIEHAEIRAEVARVEPLLQWTHGAPANSEYAATGEADLDGASMLGAFLFNSGDLSHMPSMLSMVHNGKPYRTTTHARYEPGDFSRDAALGYVQASIAANDITLVKALENYISVTGRLCEGDDRCNVTPAVRLLIREAQGYKPNALERAQDEATLIAEASTVPANYRAYLVLRKLDSHFRLTGVTAGYKHALQVILKRFPQGVYQRLLMAEVEGSDLAPIAEQLVTCMRRFPTATRSDWIGSAIDKECSENPQGHELVMLAKRILR